ncbi:hypothetical protein [Methanoculleus sp.]|uniref:hypothetical protein n=1 Tax=Methanoculleus sp. TaxID=90427 RepID=UPI0025CEE9B1|nr:hypothetical protein [Methanoculleus sp.]
MGCIEKELPLLGNRRQGLYRIKDCIFDFWYNFVLPHRQAIETEGLPSDAVDMNPYFGKRFEIFVRSEFARKVLPGLYYRAVVVPWQGDRSRRCPGERRKHHLWESASGEILRRGRPAACSTGWGLP